MTIKLQILHASDLEGGLEALEDAPRFSSIVNALTAQFPEQTLLLSSGDNYISGPFFAASSDRSLREELGREGVGRGDITIMNAIGFDASALGNHEFDLGTSTVASLIEEDGDYPGTSFPYLSANLDFSADRNLGDVIVPPGQAPQPNSIAPSTILNIQGEAIGIVGATTPLLASISSPGADVVISPSATEREDIAALASTIQPAIDDLINRGVNKIILVTHLQQLDNERELARRLQGVDAILAGGSDTRLADATDRLRAGEVAEGPYPILETSASGEPVAVITTDGNYKYVGRLVADFDDRGVLIPESIDPNVSGAFATDAQGVVETGNFPANPKVEEVTTAIGEVIFAKDSSTFGNTTTFINGERADVRTQETNLGNLTADANLFAARQVDPSAVISIKNGGGIRASIGAVDSDTGEKTPPIANPDAGKQAGEISQLDIENSLRFNNQLTLLTLTANQLKQAIEHGVAASEPGATPGQFPQVGGMAFSFDASLPAGQRVRSLAVIDDRGNAIDTVVANGELVGDPNRTFRTVTLNFLADGGDDYPFPEFSATANRVDLVGEGVETSFDTFGTEQKALADYLAAIGTFQGSDRPPTQDDRIQNLAVREDTIIDSGINLNAIGTYESGIVDEGAAEIVAHDPTTQRLFVVNANDAAIDVLDVSNPSNPTKLFAIDVTAYGAVANSVAVKNNLVAVAVENENKQAPGAIAFFDTNGNFLNVVPVGSLPDMVTFTPDGQTVLVANEGEPNDDYTVDPEGSVSVINLAGGVANATVTTAGFSAFSDRADQLSAAGLRIFGPGATLAQDLEPEYIAVSPNSQTAWISLQENNAFAKLDIPSAQITDILPLGFKNHRGQLQTFAFDSLPNLGTTAAGENILLGGFSGLFYEGINPENGNWQFVTHPDRGPNAEPVDTNGDGISERPFPLPSFQPEIVRFELNPTSGAMQITERIKLTRQDGTPLTGLPNLAGENGLAYADEVPIDLFGNPLPRDPFGADMEGIVRGADGTYWMVDEYRPAIYHFLPNGQLANRFVPEGSNASGVNTGVEAIPAVFAQRRANRGFEAVAYNNGKLYAFIQSPIDNPDVANDASSKNSQGIRILEFDTATGTTTGQYFYILEGGGSDKIGDAVALGNGEFLVLERDDATGPDAQKNVFQINLAGATNLNGLDPSIVGPNGSLESLTAEQLSALGIQPVQKQLYADLVAWGYDFADKPEGLARIDENTIAVINDNDFGLAGGFDPVTGRLEENPNPQTPVLGIFTRGKNGLDVSDRDSGINIRNWPIWGMYQPDAIAAYEANGQTYIVSANEGDARDRDGFSEEARVADLTLDPTAFPNAAQLQAEDALGRLTVTTTKGDRDGDGDYDELYAFGSRSFSIWDSNGNLIYDSGDELERIVAERLPQLFNSEGNAESFDSRSDNKGPEPEGVAIGEIDGRPHAFIGLERVGGIMVYDISNPAAPTFVDYVNNNERDIAPEGLAFISAENSPNGQPLLAAGNEVSGTTTLYQASDSNGGTPGTPSEVLEGNGSSNTLVADWNAKANTILRGFGGQDLLIGAGGNDILDGGIGSDILAGGDGSDIYAYNAPTEGADLIGDFAIDPVTREAVFNNAFQISAAGFGGGLVAGTALSQTATGTGVFVSGSAPVAIGSSGNFLYNTESGLLSYDVDGTGSLQPVAIAIVMGSPSLNPSQFAIV